MDFEAFDEIYGDEPDGAYFALAEELGVEIPEPEDDDVQP